MIFYILAPLPTIYAKGVPDDTGKVDVCTFLTMGIIISSFALPVMMARTDTIGWPACYLTISGNAAVYLTILGYFIAQFSEEF